MYRGRHTYVSDTQVVQRGGEQVGRAADGDHQVPAEGEGDPHRQGRGPPRRVRQGQEPARAGKKHFILQTWEMFSASQSHLEQL